MLYAFRKFGVALIGAALVALLSLLPAAASTDSGGGGYGSMGGYGMRNSYGSMGSTRMGSYGSMGGYGSRNSYGSMRNYGSSNGYGSKSYGSSNSYSNSYSHVRTILYWVRFGDTLGGIAFRFHTTVGAILRVNPGIQDPNLIFAGMKVWVPAGAMPLYGTSYGGSGGSSYGASGGSSYGGSMSGSGY
jgi:hypothetical protein